MVRKFLFVLTVTISFVLASGTFLTYLYQDQLVQQFIHQANQVLSTPVKVKSIRLSLWEKFPQVAISLQDVEISGSLPAKDSVLARAEKLDFTFNVLDLLKGDYVINKVYLTNSHVMLVVDDSGKNNYSIFNKRENPSTENAAAPLRFQLQNIQLQNVKVSYKDQPLRQHHSLLAEDVTSLLEVVGEQYKIQLEGQLRTYFIRIGEDAYFRDKPLQVATRLHYDYSNRYLQIDTTAIRIGQGEFLLSGLVDQAHDNYVDLNIQGRNTNLQTLLSLLPEVTVRQWQAYRSEGVAYLNGIVQGNVTREANPLVELSFGCQNASFYHPGYRKKLENISLQGSFTNGSLHSLRSSVLVLKSVSGSLDGHTIAGSLSLSNFDDYFLRTHLKSQMDVNSLLAFYPIPQIKAARGQIDADFEISGRLKDLQGKTSRYWRRVHSQGDINLQNLDILWNANRLPVESLSGNLMFKGNDLSLSDLEAQVGNSHFRLNGMLRNAFAYLLSDTQPVRIEADLYSRKIDLDELLSGELSEEVASQNWQTVANKQPYRFELDPRLKMNFDCHVERVKFRRFRGRQLKGKLDVENQQAHLRQASIYTAGGKVTASGRLNARRPDIITVDALSSFEHLQADSIFYTFEDFGQGFLTARHLEGKVYADVEWDMTFDHTLQLDYPSLRVDVLATIREGVLNEFEPMQELARFVEEESLARLRFAELNNHIRILNERIFVPRMQVNSNVSKIWLEGIHTFDNHIDYHFEIPMKTFSIRKAAARERAKAREKRFGQILEDNAAPLNLFLSAKGTVDEYKISYDMEHAREAFQNNLQKEKNEVRDIFKNKGQRPKYQLELEENEYFEFGKKKATSGNQPR